MISIIGWTIGGALLGGLVALGLYVLGFGAEFINCACNIAACDFSGGDLIPAMWNWDSFIRVLIFCAIGGAAIGLVIGFSQARAKGREKAAERAAQKAESARRQRTEWAEQIQKKAREINGICSDNSDLADCPLVSATYQSGHELEQAFWALTKAAAVRGEIKTWAENSAEKGGTGK